MQPNSKMITVISVVIALFLLVVFGLVIKNALFGGQKDTTQNQVESTTAGDSASTPIALLEQDKDLTGEEFSEKYAGKYVSFDGLIQGTSTLRGAPAPHTMLVMGDDINSATFADGSAFWITSGTSTFSDELQQFANNNSTPYETGVYPKVRVVAKVLDYSDEYTVLQLEPLQNIDGSTPSVSSR